MENITMDKKWLLLLANDIGERHGKEVRNRIFDNIDIMVHAPECLSDWFENFVFEMDKLDDKIFLQQMMANHSPCGGDYEEDGKVIRELYENSKTLEEFGKSLKNWFMQRYDDEGDDVELHGNLLYLTKPLSYNNEQGSCGKGCHCWLAMHTDKIVSDIFCYCCTIGHTGRPFQVAFGDGIKMEFVESIICGGKACVMTVHLPEKHMTSSVTE